MATYHTEISYSANKRPRGKLKQIGSNRGWLYDHAYRPSLQRLNEYHSASLYETTYSSGLSIMIQTLISMLSEPEHDDPEIQEFLCYAVNEADVPFSQLINQMVHGTLWAGYSVSESLFRLDSANRVVLQDAVTYHPATIIMRTDDRGRLTEGDVTLSGLRSGIYQCGRMQPEVQLPMWKVTRLVNDPNYHPYYGRSLIEASYKYYLLKEALLDMMAIALDRFGNPLLFIRIPRNASGDWVYDPSTGEKRQLSPQEMVENEMQNLGGGNALVLTQGDPDLEPDVRALTTGNNVGQSFLSAITYCEQEMARSMLIPFILLGRDTSTLSTSGAAERQMELFNMILRGMHQQFIQPIAKQLLQPLVLFNFSRSSAKLPARISLRNTTRPEDRVGLMHIIRGLTNDGYLNPQNDEDWYSVRELLQMATRDMTPEDKEFIYNQVIAPKQRHDTPTSSENEGRYTTPGRPAGTSAPKQEDLES